jgi:hypothetical protein
VSPVSGSVKRSKNPGFGGPAGRVRQAWRKDGNADSSIPGRKTGSSPMDLTEPRAELSRRRSWCEAASFPGPNQYRASLRVRALGAQPPNCPAPLFGLLRATYKPLPSCSGPWSPPLKVPVHRHVCIVSRAAAGYKASGDFPEDDLMPLRRRRARCKSQDFRNQADSRRIRLHV